jgi:hypothetical protein
MGESLFVWAPNSDEGETKLMKNLNLRIEELEQRIAPGSGSSTNASSTGKSNGATPEVPVGAHPQPNP